MKITVVGMGKIGLPLAVQFASKGHDVEGIDIDVNTIRLINRGQEPFPGETGLSELLSRVVVSGKLKATSNLGEAISTSEAVVVVVPLVVDALGKPDFYALDSVTSGIGQYLRKGTLVSYETTLPVGTTKSRFATALENNSGLVAGEDFFVCFSPERVLTGRVFQDLRRYPKLIGGINEKSARRAKAFYESVLDFDLRTDLERGNGVWDLGSSEASELAKLAETTYRDVNIALVNQFAKFADSKKINLYEVIEACNSQGFSHLHQPGIAVGGHCIPVYPQMYLWNDPDATLIAEARKLNESMPKYAVDQIVLQMGGIENLKVVVLGAAYRGGVKEVAFSGVYPITNYLKQLGAKVYVHDPLFSDTELSDLGFEPFHLGEHADVAILQANHPEYLKLKTSDLPGINLILDGRNSVPASISDFVPTLRIGLQSLR